MELLKELIRERFDAVFAKNIPPYLKRKHQSDLIELAKSMNLSGEFVREMEDDHRDLSRELRKEL